MISMGVVIVAALSVLLAWICNNKCRKKEPYYLRNIKFNPSEMNSQTNKDIDIDVDTFRSRDPMKFDE